MAADAPLPERRSYLPVSLTLGGVATAIFLVAQFQGTLASQSDVAELRTDHDKDNATLQRRIDDLDTDGTRGLAELRGALSAIEARLLDKTADRFTGTDWAREDRRIQERHADLQSEVDRLRGFVVELERRQRGICNGNGAD